ncbi:MAG: Flp1 family type IVb pilin [Acutalibacteraceae bacterium]|nr:Flp1 family type IVb pilin [Acutalibacteraceae bacterium]
MINKARAMAFCAGAKLRNFFTKENGEVNIVATVILIGIAVILAIVFKDAIKTLLENMLDSISDGAKGVIATEAP